MENDLFLNRCAELFFIASKTHNKSAVNTIEIHLVGFKRGITAIAYIDMYGLLGNEW